MEVGLAATNDLLGLLDGKLGPLAEQIIDWIGLQADEIGYPCFLRTGHTAGKHEWIETCYLTTREHIPLHVYRLVEYSVLADMFGLPLTTWVVRELIETEPLFHAFRGEMPITREFRVFTGKYDGDVIGAIQPYWPVNAIEGAGDFSTWIKPLKKASMISTDEAIKLHSTAENARLVIGGGEWSVDFLQDKHGEWWLTDMAPAEISYRWEPGWEWLSTGHYIATGDGPERPEIDYSKLIVGGGAG